jgi:glycosyltransferase involved in cell wall biosynthesis
MRQRLQDTNRQTQGTKLTAINMRGYVFAQCSGRDSYQLPVALQERRLLEVFCTDFYLKDALTSWVRSPAARARKEASGLLPDHKVKISWATVFWQQVSARCIHDKELRAYFPDSFLTRLLARTAAARDAHIMTYEPWAVSRPEGGFPGGRRQVIFHCHPHVVTEDKIYTEDRARFPEFYSTGHVTQSRWRQRTANAWRQADLVLCASSFSKQSLMAAGMEEEKIVVVPYGTSQPKAEVTNNGLRAVGGGERPEARSQRSANGGRMSVVGESLPATCKSRLATGSLRLLFVGRNPLRKGLHHLLLAWKNAARNPEDRLTIVCREKPAALLALAGAGSGVEWLNAVSNEELHRLYAEADALVVPSLCEGFGHVYLEAMAHGCPVVGTAHSVLPDIGGEEAGVFLVEAGDVDQLARLIGSCSANKEILESKRAAAGAQPARFKWENFRRQVGEAIETLL